MATMEARASPTSVVITAPLAKVQDGFQYVESSRIPRSAVKACSTGSWIAAVSSLRVSASCSGSRMRSRISASTGRSEEHTSELQSLMRTSYAVFCLTKKTNSIAQTQQQTGKLHEMDT